MAKQSLASKTNPAAPAGTTLPATIDSNPGHDWLPESLRPKDGAIAVSSPGYKLSPYATFASTKGPAFARISQFIPELEDGDPVLIFPEPKRPMRLNPFKFYLLRATQHWSIVDSKGQIIKATFSQDHAKTAPGKWDEHLETVLIIVTPEGLVPARATFKTTKTNAIHRGLDTLSLIENEPESWYAASPDHKMTQVVPVAWGKFLSTVRLKKGTGGGTGFSYVAATSVPTPTSAADWTLLGSFLKDKDNHKLIDDCVEQHERRLESIRNKQEG